jgi:hypothetical protein
MMEDNRYAPPKATLEGARAIAEPAPALWNPNAAASWCLLFTPVFGAWLHTKNWEALGQPERARRSHNWFVAAIVVLVGAMVLSIVVPRGGEAVSRIVSFGFLIAWYYASGKPQVGYIKARYGDDYPRKPWLQPILAGIGLIVGLFVIGVAALLMTSRV